VQARFGAFTFDDGRREMRRNDQLVHLSPKAFDLLGLMLRRRPNAVSKADPHADICFDPIGVSRHHAVIVVRDDGAMLRDLSSKNASEVEGSTCPTTGWASAKRSMSGWLIAISIRRPN